MPAHIQTSNFDGRVFELGLPGDRIDRRVDRSVYATGTTDLGRPVHRGEGLAGPHRIARMHPHHAPSPRTRHFRDVAVRKSARGRIAWMQFDGGLRTMPGKAHRLSGAGHRMPLVAHAAGVEDHRSRGLRRIHGRACCRGDEARAPVGMEEAAVAEEALVARAAPGEGSQRIVGGIVERGAVADIEIARARVLERRQGGVLAEDVGDAAPGEGLAIAEALCDLREDPPVLLRLAGRRQEGPLARDAALRIGHRAVLLRPGQRRQADAAGVDGVGGADRL